MKTESTAAIAARLPDGGFLSSDQITKTQAYVPVTWNDSDGKLCFWHSSAHIMAEAVLRIFPAAKLTIGPPIEEGFYYDIDFGDTSFTQQNIEAVEQAFKSIAGAKNYFTKEETSKEYALNLFADNPYKTELIEALPEGEKITLFHSGTFTDLCKGPHLTCSTEIIKSFKILSLAGSYWRGNSANKQLTRLYAISFPTTEEMEVYLKQKEEAKQYDHRTIGERLKLFAFSENVGNGLPLWLPNGFEVRHALQSAMMRVQKGIGYKYVITPHLAKSQLYKVSGHYEKYQHSSFSEFTTPDEDEKFMLKPMNCPHHAEVFKCHPRSYKELPLRLAENGNVCRYEPSGTLHGLTRVRAFCQDDAHIFCTVDQLGSEIGQVIKLVRKVFSMLGFNDYRAQISVRDKQDLTKYIGSQSDWDKAEQDLIDAAKEHELEATIVPGEAAFYGPKIDIQLTDSMGRSWQLSTIQVDYQLPERFNLEYAGGDNKRHRPVMIHRAIFGSYERVFALLLEHYKGNLPAWLAPLQIRIVNISDAVLDYAKQCENIMQSEGFRVDTDFSNERLAKKILNAEHLCIPILVVIGNKEMNNDTVNIRLKLDKTQKEISLTDLTAELKRLTAIPGITT